MALWGRRNYFVVLLEPAPAVPLGLVLELDGLDEDDDEPPLAWSFLVVSVELDEELDGELDMLGEVVPEADEELGELGVAVVPLADEELEPDGEVVAPDGEVADELEERSAPRSHAVSSVAPSARETATATVDILMGPPWLGYWKEGARIGPRQFLIVGWVSLERGPLPSSFDWKSRRCSACFGSTWPCVGFAPSRLSVLEGALALGAGVFADVVEDPAAAEGTADELSVFGDGGVAVLRSHPDRSTREKTSAAVHRFIIV